MPLPCALRMATASSSAVSEFACEGSTHPSCTRNAAICRAATGLVAAAPATNCARSSETIRCNASGGRRTDLAVGSLSAAPADATWARRWCAPASRSPIGMGRALMAAPNPKRAAARPGYGRGLSKIPAPGVTNTPRDDRLPVGRHAGEIVPQARDWLRERSQAAGQSIIRWFRSVWTGTADPR